MTEYVGYYESHIGHYMPIIVIIDENGNKEFQKMKKDDIMRIPDQHNTPGNWLYKKGQSIRESWQKRFMILRGPYLFYFHNHQSDRPVGVVPLENCLVVEPNGGAKSFTEQRFFRANDGFEFEIRHPTRRSFLLYATSEEERESWMELIDAETGRVNGLPIKESHDLLSRSSINTISKQSSKVIGNKVENVSLTRTQLPSRFPPPSNVTSSPQSDNNATSPIPNRQSARYSATPFSPPPPPNLASASASGRASVTREHSASIPPTPTIVKFGSTASTTPIAPPLPPNISSTNGSNIGAIVRQSSVERAVADSTHRGEEVKRQQTIERQMLEKDLQEKMRIQQEGRKREAIARERAMSRQRVEAARALESKNPMTLAELFRLILFFVNEELVEEPLPDTPLQFPHLRGEWAENMLSTVYRRYCRSSGYMSLEEFVEFLEDSAILGTHVPHDENDEPLAEFQAQLDPVRLLTTVPRNLGYSLEMESELTSGTSGRSHDNFIVNFAQFYQLLLRIAHVVYSDLYSQDPSHALNKLLQESILPLYGWTQGHSKRGSTDSLVTEERIVLLLSLYAPNLWKVFLLYCQDHQAKVPELNLPYPDAAKGSERILFGVPYGAPFNRQKFRGLEDIGYFMTDSACIKFCQDYGLSPHLMSTKHLKQLLKTLNRDKALSQQRKLQEESPPTVYFQKTLTTQMREQSSEIFQKEPYEPMRFHGVETVREQETSHGMGGVGKRSKYLPLHLTNPAVVVKEHGGLGFSEFVELIARIAVDGMQVESYHVLFPTPFSKVLAILTVWGVADLRKIEEVRILRTETIA